MVKMKVRYLGDLRTECIHEAGARIETDAPKDNFGSGEMFSPTDLVAASLSTCMMTLMAIAAKKIGVDLKGCSAEVEKQMAETAPRRVGKIIVRFRCPLTPSAIEREKLEKAAAQCPVHYSLHPDIKLEYDFVWGL